MDTLSVRSSTDSFSRAVNSHRLNSIINHPDVHPWVALPGQGYIDCSELVSDERNHCFNVPYGCFIMIYKEPGLYEAHSNFLPEGRGANVFVSAQKTLSEMFLGTECMEIVTQVPSNNIAARKFIEKTDFRLDYSVKTWPTDKGLIDSAFYSMTYNDWIRGDTGLGEVGEWFHFNLKEAKHEAGMKENQHGDDPAHDIRVGAAISMARKGQAQKAVWLYNRWAMVCGYAPVRLHSEKPLIVDIQEAVVEISNEEVRICQLVQ